MHQIFQTGNQPWRDDYASMLLMVLLSATAILAVSFLLAYVITRVPVRIRIKPRREKWVWGGRMEPTEKPQVIRLFRRWWLGLVAVLVIVIILLAINSPNPNSGPSTAPHDRKRSKPEAVFAADNRWSVDAEKFARGNLLTLDAATIFGHAQPDHSLRFVPDTLWGKTIGERMKETTQETCKVPDARVYSNAPIYPK